MAHYGQHHICAACDRHARKYLRQYQIALILEGTGEFEILEEFSEYSDAGANLYAERNYHGQPWYVLRNGRNINGGPGQE